MYKNKIKIYKKKMINQNNNNLINKIIKIILKINNPMIKIKKKSFLKDFI